MGVLQRFVLDSPVEQSNKRRIIYLLLALSCFGLGVLLNYTYRPFVYSNHINDWHLADVIGNMVAVPATAFFYYALNKTIRHTRFTVLLVDFIIWCLYEVFLSHTFDWRDILASLIMCLATYPILTALTKTITKDK